MPLLGALQPEIITSALFPRTCGVLEEGAGTGATPGAVAGAFSLRHPDRAFLMARGQRRIFPSAQPMEVGTPFDLASLTKVIVTASLSALLVDRGWLSWETPIREFFDVKTFDGIQVRHLLSHTAGFVAWKPFWQELREHFGPERLADTPVKERQAEMRRLILEVRPEAPPGEKCVYSDLSAILMGFILEDALRLPLDQAARSYLWDPWGLDSFRYHRTNHAGAAAVRDETAATESCPWRRRVLQGQVHDDNCWAMGGYSGHSGVFGTAEDVLLFAKRLMDGAYSSDVLSRMWTRVASPPGCERTLGWDTPSREAPSCGRYFSASTVGHLGFTGTSLWIDPKEGLAVVLLTNRVHPTRENGAIRELRPRFHDAFREDWRELHR